MDRNRSRIVVASAFSGALVLGAAGLATAATGASPVQRVLAAQRTNLREVEADDDTTTSDTQSSTNSASDSSSSVDQSSSAGSTTSAAPTTRAS